MAEHTAEKIINLLQMEWDDRSGSTSVPYLQLRRTIQTTPHSGLQLIIGWTYVRTFHDVSEVHSFGFTLSGVQTLSRWCVLLDKKNICCLPTVSSCFHRTWFLCLVPNCIGGRKEVLLPLQRKWHYWWNWSTGVQTLASNSIRFWFPRRLFSPLTRSYFLVWIKQSGWCHWHRLWLAYSCSPLGSCYLIGPQRHTLFSVKKWLKGVMT